jgi:hypothetical protein
MGTRGRILIAVVAIAILATLAWAVFQAPAPEPEYKGKPLSEWLLQLTSGTNYSQSARSEAELAVREIGPNATPTLLLMLEKRDSTLKVTILRFLYKHHFVKSPLITANQNFAALAGFRILGSSASNAVPRLIAIFDSDPAPFPQQAVPEILGEIGPAAAPAIPALLRGTSHTNANVRNNSIYALRQIHAEPELVVPAFISLLNDPENFVQAQAARGLGAFGGDAKTAFPALLALWRKETLNPTGGTIGVFDTTVSSSWNTTRYGATRGGGYNVLGSVRGALKAIDPKAAAEAGVK